jgi:hypothetical protein
LEFIGTGLVDAYHESFVEASLLVDKAGCFSA